MAAILVIDDDPGVRRLIRSSLERAGHSVVEADDGVAGMRLYRSQPIDLVITDLFMPGQDGIETIQELRADGTTSRIIAISGGATIGAEGPLSDARLFGADAVLAKPFGVADLVSLVRELLS